MMTRSPLSDLRYLRHATPEQAAAWRRLRELVEDHILGGELDGEITLRQWYHLRFWRWVWKDRRDR